MGERVFQNVNEANFPANEQTVREIWNRLEVFEQSLAKNQHGPRYTFYEGPPTANGRPGVHHALSRSYKDLFPRFKTMQGYYVPRRAGWDCHGLPVELEVEKRLGLGSKKEIEAYGIAEFNQACRESVRTYEEEWRVFSERIGFWADFDQAYYTMDPGYVESVWWSLKELWQKGLIYQDYKVVPYCPRCGTPLSSHEVAQGYEEISDPSVYVRFPILEPEDSALPPGSALLAWTTTPWTLPGNVALAVHPELSYGIFPHEEGPLLLEENLGRALLQVEPLSVRSGSSLVGISYQPPFEFQSDPRAFRVFPAQYVTSSEGTGVVHQAPAFGLEDMELARANNLPIWRTVDEEGKLTVGPFQGVFFRDANRPVIAELRHSGRLFLRQDYRHSYPHCWRCHTPLMYYASDSWFIGNTRFKEKLIEENQNIDWVPAHIKEGRYGSWLNNLTDWAISRNRYWGTPLPFWVCQSCHHQEAIGSVAELADKTGRELSGFDPHRPHVDQLEWNCPECGGVMRRVPFVLDVWYDSGAMPFAQLHYPLENKTEFSQSFPADFICEAIDQTRGWFNSLHQIGVMLFGSRAFQHVISLGLILDEAGQKMSKSRGNTVEPGQILDAFGADPLRWYLFSLPPESDRRFGPGVMRETIREFFLPLWNIYRFFVTYANLDHPNLGTEQKLSELDHWLWSRTEQVTANVTEYLENYNPAGAAREIRELVVRDLSQWYVRRSRRRFWRGDDPVDSEAAYATLYHALVRISLLLAPFTPHLAETLYQNLVLSVDTSAPASVHLANWPQPDRQMIDSRLLQDMESVLAVVELGRSARAQSQIKTRIPLAKMLVSVPEAEKAAVARFGGEIAEELNLKQVELVSAEALGLAYRVKPLLPVLGPKLGRRLGELRQQLERLAPAQAARLAAGQTLELELSDGPLSLSPSEVLIEALPPAGYATAEAGGRLVALTATIEPELYREGLERDLIRSVQQARKEMGLEVSDRIELSFTATGTYAEVLSHPELIARETLATAVVAGEPQGFLLENSDEDGAYRIGIARVK